jgi:hypothetical protein
VPREQASADGAGDLKTGQGEFNGSVQHDASQSLKVLPAKRITADELHLYRRTQALFQASRNTDAKKALMSVVIVRERCWKSWDSRFSSAGRIR